MNHHCWILLEQFCILINCAPQVPAKEVPAKEVAKEVVEEKKAEENGTNGVEKRECLFQFTTVICKSRHFESR